MGSNSIGFGMIIQDFRGVVLYFQTQVVHGNVESHLAKGFCLKEALSWLYNQGLSKVIVELDSKILVDALNSSLIGLSEFGVIISSCIHLLQNYNYVFVCNFNAWVM